MFEKDNLSKMIKMVVGMRKLHIAQYLKSEATQVADFVERGESN